jgi:hypothetical protein
MTGRVGGASRRRQPPRPAFGQVGCGLAAYGFHKLTNARQKKKANGRLLPEAPSAIASERTDKKQCKLNAVIVTSDRFR